MILYPKLRHPLDITLHTEGTEPNRESYLVFRCPLGLVRPSVLVSAIGPVISQFTGEHSIDEIASALSHLGATRQLISDLVRLCDDNLLLDSPRFQEQLQATLEAFRNDPIRPPAHAGLTYPHERVQLEHLIASYLNPHQGLHTSPLIGLMVPHIDFSRGGQTYGVGYSALRSTYPDVIILLGTAHQASRHLFHLTTKDFALPFRTFVNDSDSTHLLANHYGRARSFEDEFLHKHEHSLELQLPFLHTSVGTSAKIVPILIGSFHSFILAGRYPDESEPYQSFIGALQEMCRSILRRGESFLLLAGVDMAHCGMAFGEKSPLTAEDLQIIEQRDTQYLSSIQRRDPRGIFEHIAEDRDARRICGFPTMYLMLDLLNILQPSGTPSILDYRQAFDPKTDTCVTFGAASFPLA